LGLPPSQCIVEGAMEGNWEVEASVRGGEVGTEFNLCLLYLTNNAMSNCGRFDSPPFIGASDVLPQSLIRVIAYNAVMIA